MLHDYAGYTIGFGIFEASVNTDITKWRIKPNAKFRRHFNIAKKKKKNIIANNFRHKPIQCNIVYTITAAQLNDC